MSVRFRPATGLSLVLAIAFGLHLVSILSVPVTRAITLSTYDNVQYGVFGYCNTTTNVCSSVGIGYDNAATNVDGFSLSSSARHTLASLLIVNVVAAGLTLILLILTIFAHLKSASHSSKYLLIVFFFSIPCFLISLMAFLVDILLFVPHLGWGGWIVLAATVLVLFSNIMLCVVRRSLSSDKARRALRARNTSEMFNLNAPLEFVPDGGMVYGGENISKPPSMEYVEGKYDPIVRHESVPENLNNGLYNTQNGHHLDTTYTSESVQPFSSTDNNGTFNQHNNFRPDTSNTYRGYHNDRGINAPIGGYAASDYSQSNYSSYQPNGSHTTGNSDTAGTPPTRSIMEGVVPAGTYGDAYDDTQNLDYSSFGGNVVSVPQIRNPGALRQKTPSNNGFQSHPIPQTPSTPQRANTCQGYTNVSQPLSTAYESTEHDSTPKALGSRENDIPVFSNSLNEGESAAYDPPRPRWRQYAPASQQMAETDFIPPNQTFPQQQQPPQQQGRSNPRGQNSASPHIPSEPLGASSEHQTLDNSHQALRNVYLDHDDNDQYTQFPTRYRAPSTDAISSAQDTSLLHVTLKTSEHSLVQSTSPAISDSSHFTSVSQRGPNPKYIQLQQQKQQQALQKAANSSDFVLDNNPDFQLPSGRNKFGNRKPDTGRKNMISPLKPGFGSLDGPYGVSRGI